MIANYGFEPRCTVGAPAPADEALQTVLKCIITRTVKLITRRGLLVC
jgi:hypothetical protein